MSRYFSGLVMGLILGGLIAVCGVTLGARAQVPATAAVETTPVGLSENEQLMLQLLTVQAKLASVECNAIDSMKTFLSTREDVVRRIEANHPGYLFDLPTGKLIAKKK